MKLRHMRALPSFLVLLLAAPAFAGASFAQDDGAQDEPPPAQEEAEEEEERGLKVNAEGAFQGYTLISPLQSKEILLIDMQGEVVHRWQTEHAPGGGFYLLEDGSILRSAREEDNPVFHGGGIGGRIQRIAWDGSVTWEYRIANERQTQHHDLEPLPNGNVLVIVWEKLSVEDAVELGRDPSALHPEGLWPDAVLELRPIPPDGAEVVWEWHAWDHLIQDFDEERSGYGSIPDQPGLIDINADHRDEVPITEEERRKLAEIQEQMRALGYVGGEDDEEEPAAEDDEGREIKADWLHTNAIDYHPELDLIVLSTPHMCELWVIDHSTTTEEAAGSSGGRWGRGGELLWRWGNAKNYGLGVRREQKLWYQHDPTWIDGPAGELRLLVFNNGGSRPGGDRSSVDELVLPFDRERGFTREPDKAFGPREPEWSYEDPGRFFSSFISGAQRLPNGSTLICQGAGGRVFEVTRSGEIVWEWLNPHGGDAPSTRTSGQPPKRALFRATRLPLEHPGIGANL